MPSPGANSIKNANKHKQKQLNAEETWFCVSPLFTFEQVPKTWAGTTNYQDSPHTCSGQVEQIVAACCHAFLAASTKAMESRSRLQMGVNMCQPCCGASCRRDEKQEGEEVCIWTCMVNKAAFYRCTEKPSFNEKSNRVQVRVRKSDLPFLMGHTFIHEGSSFF